MREEVTAASMRAGPNRTVRLTSAEKAGELEFHALFAAPFQGRMPATLILWCLGALLEMLVFLLK
jgi:hypothetical protein